MDISELIGTIFLSPLKIGTVELPFDLSELLVGFVLPVLVLTLVYRLIVVAVKRILKRLSAADELQKRVLHWTRLALRLLYLFLLILIVGRLFGARIFEYLGRFYEILNQPIISSGNTRITFVTLILTIPIFYLAAWAGKASRSVLRKSLLGRIGLDEAQQFSVVNLTRYAVMVIVLLIGLSVIGIDLSALTVIFGVLGIGLGFGLQHVVSNFFSGLVIIITRPVKEGDRVLVQGTEGTILQIRILSTVINTLTNESIIVPNSHIVQETVHNFSFYDPSVIIKNEIGVSYASDVDLVMKVLLDIAERNPFRMEQKRCWVYLKEFGNSSLDFTMYTWIRSMNDKFEAHHWNNLEIWRKFRENGIEIPFPQLDLHQKS